MPLGTQFGTDAQLDQLLTGSVPHRENANPLMTIPRSGGDAPVVIEQPPGEPTHACVITRPTSPQPNLGTPSHRSDCLRTYTPTHTTQLGKTAV